MNLAVLYSERFRESYQLSIWNKTKSKLKLGGYYGFEQKRIAQHLGGGLLEWIISFCPDTGHHLLHIEFYPKKLEVYLCPESGHCHSLLAIRHRSMRR